MTQAPLVTCPQCGNSSVFSPINPSRPFCSVRCKMIDLGAWANESYRVPGVEKSETREDRTVSNREDG